MSQIFKNCFQMFESYPKKKKSCLYKNMNYDCKCVS